MLCIVFSNKDNYTYTYVETNVEFIVYITDHLFDVLMKSCSISIVH